MGVDLSFGMLVVWPNCRPRSAHRHTISHPLVGDVKGGDEGRRARARPGGNKLIISNTHSRYYTLQVERNERHLCTVRYRSNSKYLFSGFTGRYWKNYQQEKRRNMKEKKDEGIWKVHTGIVVRTGTCRNRVCVGGVCFSVFMCVCFGRNVVLMLEVASATSIYC